MALSDRASRQRGNRQGENPVDGTPPSHEARWLRRLAGYCWRFKRDVIIALTGALIYTVATLVIPLLQRNIIDNVIVTHKESV